MLRKMHRWFFINAVVLCLIMLIIFPAWANDKSMFEVHFIDVGQGDSILLHSTTGVDILIDAGQPPYGKKIIAYLEKLGITDLDYVISTHPHSDHIGGLVDVISQVPVKNIIDPGVVYATGIFETYLSMIKDKKIPFRTVLQGDVIEVDDPLLHLEVLAPYEDQLDYGDDVNDVSIMIRVIYGDVSFLLTGDAGFSTEDRLVMQKVKMKSTILKVGHHGSKYSTGELFLFCVEPEIAVIQVGENNYGHPTEEVLDKLTTRGVEIYRNDLQGTIVISTDGQTYNILTEKVFAEEIDMRININTAPFGDLIELPGISYDLAQEIVDYREIFGMFLSKEELLRVDLMTVELLEQILPYIKFTE